MIEQYPLLTLVPPVLAIALVLLTKRVLVSLGAGVLAAALLVANVDVVAGVGLVWQAFSALFWDEGAVNTGRVYILLFCLLLGIIAALVMMSGGTYAFSQWAEKRVRSRRGAMALPAILGIAIFIDDYVNALAVGQVSRPITDRHRVSRAKLAYIVDSSSAPVSVLAPFSSWGASIIGIMAPIVAASTLTVTDLGAFMSSALMNYYAIAALALVWIVIGLGLDVGAMRTEETRALDTGDTFDPGGGVPGELSADLPEFRPGAKRALVLPFVALVVGVLAGIAWTGHSASGSWDPTVLLAETDVTEALMWGGLLGFAAALYYYLRYTGLDGRFSTATLGQGVVEGAKSMWPAISILVLAWTLGDLIEQLGTGEYLGGLVNQAPLPTEWLVPLLFVLAGGMAFATGTSWGSFGLLLPLAGQIMNNVDGGGQLLLAAFGAVLAGAVFGDHCSPISDTTILSSTGSGADVITHVTTQLPYAFISAGVSLFGYVAFALTSSAVVGLIAMLMGLGVVALIARRAGGDPRESAPASVGLDAKVGRG